MYAQILKQTYLLVSTPVPTLDDSYTNPCAVQRRASSDPPRIRPSQSREAALVLDRKLTWHEGVLWHASPSLVRLALGLHAIKLGV